MMDSDKAGVVREERSPYGEQDAWGNDVAMLRRNLHQSLEQRMKRAEEGIKFVRRFKGIATKRKQA